MHIGLGKYFLLFMIFFMVLGCVSASNNVTINGTVLKCEDPSQGLDSVNVTIKSMDDNTIASTLTDDNGKYQITLPGNLTSLKIEAKLTGHLKSTKLVNITGDHLEVNLTLGQPVITITAPSEAFINENFQVNLTFDNNATTPGFGPIAELILPPEITFLNASYLGFPAQYVDAGIFPASGELLDPLTRNITTGPPGYHLIIIEYPFGSFVPEQPPATIITNLKMALNATIGTPLNITARPIFRFGNNPLDDPADDPPIYGEAKNATITPTVIKVNKRAILHEDETATGPNYPFNYTIEVDVADGATIQDLNITDYLPGNLQFLELIDNAGGQVINLPSNTTPGGNITIKFPSITGVLGIDKTIKYRVYAPELDNTTNPVLDPNTGAPVNATNNVTATGTYNTTSVSSNSNYTVYLKSLAIQKTVKDLNGGYTKPTDTLEYTLNFQLSDYFQIKDIIIRDVVGDGQSFLETFTPTLNITEAGNTISTPFNPENYEVSHNSTTGEWTIIFYVSKQLKDLGLDEMLTGGLYENRSQNRGPTIGTITFRTTIDITYEDPAHYPSGVPNLKSGDTTVNNVQVNAKLSHNNNTVSDPSGASVTINAPTPEKIIYAINGVINAPPKVRPGDNVTFSLWVSIPTTNLCNFTISDFLPIPFFRADQITNYAGQSDMPAPGQWSIASDDTLTAYLNRTPEVEVNATNNMIIFKYGPINSTDQQERIAHILFTVTATDEPFADELYLTNQMQITYYNSPLESFSESKIQQVITQEPKLTIDKRVNSTTGPGTIDQKGDLIGADAGDTITYKIIIENIGHWNAYNVTIKDNLTAKLTEPQLINVTDGNGNPVSYTGNLFTTGINIEMIPKTDEGPGGNDTIIITFTAKIADNANPRELINNTGLITYYASTPTGPNFVADQSLYEDDATVTIASPTMEKELISSTDPGTSGNNLTIGERGTFQILIKLPEGETNNLTIIEMLPAGLRYDGYYLNTTGFNGTLPNPIVIINGSNITFFFNGTTIVYPDNNNSTDSFKINVNATADNTNPHLPSIQKTNTVSLNWYGNPGDPISTTYNFNILQPLLNITKTITPNPARARQNVTIRFNVTNNGLSPAYNVYLWDVLNSTAFNLTTVTEVTTPAGFSYTYNPLNGTIEYTGGNINPGQTLTFEFNVTLNNNVKSNSTFQNTVNATYDSLDLSTIPRTDNRVYNASATTTLRTVAPSISKTVNATSEPDSTGNNVLIGEVVTYRIDITIPAGVTSEVTIRDPIDTRYIEYITGRSKISRSSENISSDAFSFTQAGLNNFEDINETTLSPLEFYLGNITNNNPNGANETIRLLIQVVVENNGNNTAGRTIPNNTAYLDYKNDAGTNLTTLSTAPNLTVRLPSLYVNKTSNQTIIEPGGSVKFTLTIGNNPGTNIAPLYDLNVTDIIDPWFTNIRDITITKSNATINVTYNLTGNNLTAYIDRLLQGQNVNITFTADLREDAIFGSNIPNTMTVKGTSLPGPYGTNNTTPGDPGSGTGERTGDGGINNLNATSTTRVNVTAPTITKTFIDGSNLKESPIGNILTHKITISVPTGRTENLTVTDIIPTGLEASNFTYTIDPSIQTQYPNPTPTQIGNTWTINFGEVNATAPGNITIYYNITVLNIPSNINNIILTNNATITYYNGTTNITSTPASASVKIIEPILNIQKTGTNNLNPGETCTWIIKISHNTTSTSNAYDLTIEDVLPTGMNYNETISLPPGWTITIQPNKIIYKGPALNLGDNATIIFTARVDNDPSLAAKNLTNTVNITYTSLPGEISEERLYNKTTNATIHILGTDLQIQKTPSKTSPNYNEIITYHIQVKNNGPDTATNVTVEDPLPNTVIYINNTKSHGIYDPDLGIWYIGTLNPLETATLNITVKINTTGTIINYANVTANITDTNSSNNKVNATINVPPAADLAINKTANQTTVNYLDTVKFTLTVRNLGPDTAVSAVVTDLLPAGLEFVSATASQGTYNAGVWTIGDLANGAIATLDIIAKIVTSNVTIVNVANVSSSTYDWNLTNNRDNATINVPPAADLAIIKLVNATKVKYWDTVRFTLLVINLGPDTAVNARVKDLLPAGLKFVSASSPSYDPVSGIWIIGNLSKGEIAILDIIARVITSNRNITNVATVTSDIYDPNMDNNKASVTIEVAAKKPPGPGEIPMQPTGIPLLLMVFAVLSLIMGFGLSKKY